MAYNNSYTMGYPQYYGQYPQQMQNQQTYQNIQQPQIQNGGFVLVRNEEEAKNYPVALGMSVTFITEDRKHVYSKTMGFSQLDQPIFDRYKLIKEEPQKAEETHEHEEAKEMPSYALLSDYEALREHIERLEGEIEELKKKPVPTKKKEADEK